MAGGTRIVGLIVAAGRGERAGGGQPKQYRPIAGKAVLARAYDALAGHSKVDSVLTVIGAGQEAAFAEAMAGRTVPSPIMGGATRRLSVLAGLEAIEANGGADIVLIHDAARPFLPAEVVDRLIDALNGHAGAVPVLPVVDSLALGSDALGDPVSRDGLYRVQT